MFLVVSPSAIDCPERLVSEMTYYVLNGTLNPTHSFTHPMSQICETVLCRVLEQHALSKEEWQEKVVNWHMEHKSLMRLAFSQYRGVIYNMPWLHVK